MHPYATNLKGQSTVLLCIAILSIIIAHAWAGLLQVWQISIPWWVETPSILGLYWLMFAAIDQWIWKWRFLRRIKLVQSPNLSGRWEGNLVSSFDEHETQTRAILHVSQTWTKMSILLETDYSISKSQIADITIDAHGKARLSYVYTNFPKPEAPLTMEGHRGTAFHVYQANEDTESLNGEYFSGRGRQNYGAMRLSRA